MSSGAAILTIRRCLLIQLMLFLVKWCRRNALLVEICRRKGQLQEAVIV